MKCRKDTAHDGLAADDESQEPLPSCAEGMLAATLALMTGYAEHCAPPEAAAGRPAVPRLLAAKAASNLFFLAGNPDLSVPMRATLWRLRGHWQALEQEPQSRESPCKRPRETDEPAAPCWPHAPTPTRP